MQRTRPPFPADHPACFRTTVHGTVFCERARQLEKLQPGDELLILPGPPLDDEPGVWIHSTDGDVIGHLPPEIETWLAPWMLRGGSARARTLKVCDEHTPSWRRLIIEVECAV